MIDGRSFYFNLSLYFLENRETLSCVNILVLKLGLSQGEHQNSLNQEYHLENSTGHKAQHNGKDSGSGFTQIEILDAKTA